MIQCSLVAGAVFGQFLGAFSKYGPKLKWQLVVCCCLFTAFTGGMAAVSSSHESRAIVFSVISSIMIGYMEVLTLAGAPLMVDAKDIGLANGVEYTVRSGFSTLAGMNPLSSWSRASPLLNVQTDSIYVTIVCSTLHLHLHSFMNKSLTLRQLENKSPRIWSNTLYLQSLKAGLPATSLKSFLTDIGTGNLVALESVKGVTPAVLEAATPRIDCGLREHLSNHLPR